MATERLFTPGDGVLMLTADGVKPATYQGVDSDGALLFEFHSQRRGTWAVPPLSLEEVLFGD